MFPLGLVWGNEDPGSPGARGDMGLAVPGLRGEAGWWRGRAQPVLRVSNEGSDNGA